VRKLIVLKGPVWRAAGLAALLGLGLVSHPVQSAPASGGAKFGEAMCELGEIGGRGL
jgi:hypothetical protein